MRLGLKIILFWFVVTGTPALHGQAKPILVDELGGLDCEGLWSRLDGFAAEMSKFPNSMALIEIAGKRGDLPHHDFYWDGMIRGYFRLRRIPSDRWRVHRTKLGEKRRAAFWLIPPGASAPEIDAVEWSFAYPSDTKPFILTHGESYSVTGNGTCLDVDEFDLLAKALEANLRASVNVVLIVRSKRAYQSARTRIKKMLMNNYSIASSRIRMFKKIRTGPKHPWDPDAEYWFVPGRMSESQR
ncbi:MAG: hypothetical protein ABIV48_04360 [Pyrinomonadaceae bacterium]